MDRDRNPPKKQAHLVARGIIPKLPVRKKRGMAKAEKAPIVDPEEDAIWITYETEDPDMVLLQPLMKIGQVMVNPTKAGSFHCRMAAAKQIVEKLGAQYAIEGTAIVRRLVCELKFEYNVAGAQAPLRKYLLGLAPEVTKDLKGIFIGNAGKLPATKEKDWLYVSYPNQSTCEMKTGRFLKTTLEPEAHVKTGIRELKRAILDDTGKLEFASYGQQSINVLCYVAGEESTAKIIYTAIKNGTTFAMEYVAKDITVEEFLDYEIKALRESRAGDVKKVEEQIEAAKGELFTLVDKIRQAQIKRETAEGQMSLLKKYITKAALIKEYPALASVEGVNDEDPAVTVVTTKDIILNGVNLGPYRIKINPSQADVMIGGKNVPKDLTHPNLYQQDGKWVWDMEKGIQEEVITSLAMGRIAKTVNLIVSTLLRFDPANEGQMARLKRIEEYIKDKEPVNA